MLLLKIFTIFTNVVSASKQQQTSGKIHLRTPNYFLEILIYGSESSMERKFFKVALSRENSTGAKVRSRGMKVP